MTALARLRALDARATQGEWSVAPLTEYFGPLDASGEAPVQFIAIQRRYVHEVQPFAEILRAHFHLVDAEFIVALRNAFPALSARLEALERVAEAARCEYWGAGEDRSIWCCNYKDDSDAPGRWCDTCKALAALAALEDK